MVNALIIIFAVYLITLYLAVNGWVYIVKFTGDRLVDRGWALSRIFSWLSLGLVIWFLGYAKIPANTSLGIWFLVILMGIGAVFILHRSRSSIINWLASAKVFIIIEELLFLLGFFFLSFVRSFNPAILDLEKFMDAGFMASYLRSPTLPAPDMWLSGSTINYYSFGHFLGSCMTRIWFLPVSVSYNLLLGFIMGLSLTLTFSVIVNLLSPLSPLRKKPLILGGLLGAFLVNVGGNTHTIWYLLKNHHWQAYWYADATRFIDRTIHEFPSYSYVVSDLHAHVWSLPLVLSYLILISLWSKTIVQKRDSYYLQVALILGIFLGVFAMTNTWDAMIYSLLTGIAAFVLLLVKPPLFKRLCLSALVAIPAAICIALPWFITFTSISQGVQIATEHSPLWQLAALWTGHLLLSLFALTSALLILKKTKRVYPSLTVITFALTAWLLLFLPEIIFFKDIYTGHPRANTMFKFTYQGFILMSLLGGWVFGTLFTKQLLPRWYRASGVIIILIVSACLFCFPYFAYRDYYGALHDFKGLNGYLWLQEEASDDYQAIKWLNRTVKGQPYILESWGESYTKFDRVSSITGLPTVLGWRVHEWLWRGGFDIPGARTTDVDAIFNDPTSTKSRNLLKKYQVQYIFIGTKEREQYPNLNTTAIKSLGQEVYKSGLTFIVKLPL